MAYQIIDGKIVDAQPVKVYGNYAKAVTALYGYENNTSETERFVCNGRVCYVMRRTNSFGETFYNGYVTCDMSTNYYERGLGSVCITFHDTHDFTGDDTVVGFSGEDCGNTYDDCVRLIESVVNALHA